MKRNLKPAEHNGRLTALVQDLSWYAIRVPPQKEFVAQEILHRRGFATFCPFESVWRRRSRYSQEKELKNFPIMPRYVFTGFEMVPSWYHFAKIPLVVGVVGFNDEPKRLKSMGDFVKCFRNGLRRPEQEKHMRTHREYAIGDLATIVDGALAGRQVVVENIRKGHAFFRMEMFGDDMMLTLPIGKLEAA